MRRDMNKGLIAFAANENTKPARVIAQSDQTVHFPLKEWVKYSVEQRRSWSDSTADKTLFFSCNSNYLSAHS